MLADYGCAFKSVKTQVDGCLKTKQGDKNFDLIISSNELDVSFRFVNYFVTNFFAVKQ